MRASAILLGLLLFVDAASAADEALPSMELLEFLGEWGDTDPGQFAQELDGAAVLAGSADEKSGTQPKEESKDDE